MSSLTTEPETTAYLLASFPGLDLEAFDFFFFGLGCPPIKIPYGILSNNCYCIWSRGGKNALKALGFDEEHYCPVVLFRWNPVPNSSTGLYYVIFGITLNLCPSLFS